MNPQQARFNMIEQQIRPWDVLDPVVLKLLQQVPREDFVPAQYAGLAFADLEIPLGHGQTMLSPKLEARILQALQLQPADHVLEIGTGSGYLTALLAKLCRQVVSVDCVAELTEAARARLRHQGIRNVTLETGAAVAGWNAHAPYDVIVLTGSAPLLAPEWQHSLAAGGRLFAVVGQAPAMAATLIRRMSEGLFHADVLFETCIPPLRDAPQPQAFQF